MLSQKYYPYRYKREYEIKPRKKKQMKKTKMNDVSALKIPCGGKLVYLVLKEVTDRKNEAVIPIKKIARSLGIAESTVVRNLEKLRKKGLIYVQPRFKENGMRDINIYRLKENKTR